jgi:hypothetical protein
MLVPPGDETSPAIPVVMLQRGCSAARNERTVMNSVRSVIQRKRFPLDIMLVCVRWYVAYPLSVRNLEQMMQERGLFCRSFHDSPLGHQAGSGAGGSLS